MGKNHLIFILFCLFGVLNINIAQSSKKGDWNVDVGIGFGNYGTITKTETTFYSHNPYTNTTYTGIDVTGSSDALVSIIIPLKIEYRLSNKFGAGLKFGMNNFFISENERYMTSSIKSIDYGLRLSYHIINTNEKNDVFIELILGSSAIKWIYKDIPNATLTSLIGKGAYFSLAINDRFYFSNHFGLLLYGGITRYYYSNMDHNYVSTPPTQTNYSSTTTLNFDAVGINLGIGLTVKF